MKKVGGENDQVGRILLLSALGLLIVHNIVRLVQGNLLVLISLVIQSLVLGFVLGRLPGAKWVIRVWAAILMLAGIAYWVSVGLQVFAWAIYPEGGPFVERVTKLTFWGAFSRSLMLGAGGFFAWRSARIVAR